MNEEMIEYKDVDMVESQTPQDLGSMGSLLSEQPTLDMMPKHGDMREGTVVSITPTEMLVDIGTKSEGVLDQHELAEMGEAARSELQVGQRVSVCIEGEQDGALIVSIQKAEEMLAWQRINLLLQDKTAHPGSIAGYNKGGLVVDLGSLRGFLPASQVSVERRQRAVGETPSSKWGEMVGEQTTVKIIDADQKRNRLIVSERAAYKEMRDERRQQLLAELEPGQIHTGRVTSLANFGAFVDIGGANGLVHVSELGWRHVDHPSSVLEIGQKIEVQVLAVDSERKRISLSRKALETNPWLKIAQTYQEGQLVRGVITRLTKFGVFAAIDGNEKIEGLVHISEMSDLRISDPGELVGEGEHITLRIIQIDAQKERLRLSIKAVASARYADLDFELHLAAKAENELDRVDNKANKDLEASQNIA